MDVPSLRFFGPSRERTAFFAGVSVDVSDAVEKIDGIKDLSQILAGG